jgi:hypothetical protein
MTGNRTSPSLITGILDVLERHGYAGGDDEHTARAIVLISDLAHIYDGSLDHPFGPYNGEIPSRTEPAPPGPAGPDAVLIPAGQVKNLLVALDIAADHKRDRADCTGQSCPNCQWCLHDAQAYDHLAAQLIQSAGAPPAAPARHLEPAGRHEHPGRQPDREAAD